MSKHFEVEINKVKKKLLSLSVFVEESVFRAVKAVMERNYEIASEVIESDFKIDELEVEIEEDCLKVLALYQPVATDLRFVVSVLKINNDLERIGDLAVNIGRRAKGMCDYPKPKIIIDLEPMARKVQWMLRKSLESLVNLDLDLADNVRKEDDEVDEYNRQIHSDIGESMKANPEDMNVLAMYLSVIRNLERIADHTTNIAEDVIYMIEGKIVRHNH